MKDLAPETMLAGLLLLAASPLAVAHWLAEQTRFFGVSFIFFAAVALLVLAIGRLRRPKPDEHHAPRL